MYGYPVNRRIFEIVISPSTVLRRELNVEVKMCIFHKS